MANFFAVRMAGREWPSRCSRRLDCLLRDATGSLFKDATERSSTPGLFQVSIQGRLSGADDFGDIGQVHSVFSHPLRLSKFRRRHLRRPATGAATCQRGGETHLSPFTDQISFELGESSEATLPTLLRSPEQFRNLPALFAT